MDLFDAAFDIGAQEISILIEGFRDHLPVEEQMNPSLSNGKQFFGVHEGGIGSFPGFIEAFARSADAP